MRQLGVATRAEGNEVLAVCGGSVGHHAAETQVLEHVFELLRVGQFEAACKALGGLVRELLAELDDADEGGLGGDCARHDHLVELLVGLGAQFADLDFVELVQMRGVGLFAREAAVENAREVVQQVREGQQLVLLEQEQVDLAHRDLHWLHLEARPVQLEVDLGGVRFVGLHLGREAVDFLSAQLLGGKALNQLLDFDRIDHSGHVRPERQPRRVVRSLVTACLVQNVVTANPCLFLADSVLVLVQIDLAIVLAQPWLLRRLGPLINLASHFGLQRGFLADRYEFELCVE